MTKSLESGQQQALKACIQDAVAFMNLFRRAQEHPQAPLIFNSLIPIASMFVIESHRCLTMLFPDTSEVFSRCNVELLHASRHRVKLLDDGKKTIEEVTGELVTIAKDQRKKYLQPHTGFWGYLKRAMQPDMGLSIGNGHIFNTTHSTIFAFGGDVDLTARSFAFGEAIGSYTARLLNIFHIENPLYTDPTYIPSVISMRDIKYEALFYRGKLGANRINVTAGLILILASLNFSLYILPGLLPLDDPTLFRMKFIIAFHANKSLGMLQGLQMANKTRNTGNEVFFKKALGNSDSRWLR